MLEFEEGIDTVRAKLAEAQAAMGGGEPDAATSACPPIGAAASAPHG